MRLVAHLHMERARYDVRDEDVGNPSRPIRDSSQYRGIPIVEDAKSHHLQPPVPWEGIPLLRGYNGADEVSIGKTVKIKPGQGKYNVK